MHAYAADMQTDIEVDAHIDTICKFSLLGLFLTVSWKKFYSIYHLWHHGRNAKQSCGFLCILFMERN